MDQRRQILVVDDEELNRELLEDMLEMLGHDSVIADSGMEAIAKLTPEIDLVLLDVTMPGMDGFEVVQWIRNAPLYHDLPVIMVTALTSMQDRLRAVEVGANDFIAKPFDRMELRVRTNSMLTVKAAQDALKRNQETLEQTVERRTRELKLSMIEVAEARLEADAAHLDTIYRLALAGEYRDEQTHAHIQRVSHYCAVLARALDMPEDEIDVLFHSSAMHDVGKIGISDAILLKPGALTPEERAVMQQHAMIGASILSGSSSKLLSAGEIIARTHHEKWDGSGYPHGLAGEDIHVYGRICAVADVFDALTSERPYKPAFPLDTALEIVSEGRGTHFDNKIVDLFFANLGEVESIWQKYGDRNSAANYQLGVLAPYANS